MWSYDRAAGDVCADDDDLYPVDRTVAADRRKAHTPLRALAGGCVLEALCTVMIPVDVLVRLFWNRMSVWLMFALLLDGVFRTSMILLLARALLHSEEACGSLHR